MLNPVLEAQFEEQVEELKDRLHDCMQSPPGPDMLMARHILEGLIADYQEQLRDMRRHRSQAMSMSS